MDSLTLPDRTQKPREYGLTSIQDVHLTIDQTKSILEDFHSFVDIAKLGIGTAYLNPRIEKKLSLYSEYNVKTYCGGTLFEKFYHQKKLDTYLNFLEGLDIKWIEISNGTIDIPLEERIALVQDLTPDLTVIAEVGCKDTEKDLPPAEWIKEIKTLLEAGCKYIITEGRDSGTAGIYSPAGNLRKDLVRDIVSQIDYKNIIFETPQDKSQMYFINLLGANVNLGNIPPKNLLLLETQRCGMRSETFFME